MKRTLRAPIRLALACLALAAGLGACARVSLEPGSAAKRPVAFQIALALPAAAPDGTATWIAAPPSTIAFSTQDTAPVNLSISQTLAGTPSYRWYLNGAPLPGESSATLTVGGASSDTGALANGHYILSGVVAADGVVATVDWSFEVTDG